MRKEDMLKCLCCNGEVDEETFTCKYCGTKYIKPKSVARFDELNTKLEIKERGIKTLKRCMMISDEVLIYKGEEYKEFIKRQMVAEIANMLYEQKLVDFYEEEDYPNCCKIITAKIRIADDKVMKILKENL